MTFRLDPNPRPMLECFHVHLLPGRGADFSPVGNRGSRGTSAAVVQGFHGNKRAYGCFSSATLSTDRWPGPRLSSGGLGLGQRLNVHAFLSLGTKWRGLAQSLWGVEGRRMEERCLFNVR